MNEWYVYIMQCSDGSYYTGITTDTERRLQEHNHGARAAKYTRVRRPVMLVYRQVCADRSEAAKQEYQIRRLSRARKQDLIKSYHEKIKKIN